MKGTITEVLATTTLKPTKNVFFFMLIIWGLVFLCLFLGSFARTLFWLELEV
jgi:hypothetical protein